MKRSSLWIGFWLLILAAPAFPRGNKVIPQIADGGGYRTIFDLINISPAQAINGTFVLHFFKQDGTDWNIATNLGQNSRFPLTVGPRQSIRVETNGASSGATAGYAIIEDNETKNYRDGTTDIYSMDFVLGTAVYYERSTSNGVVDTVAVPISDPTALATLPVQISKSKNIRTGIAIVNLAPGSNPLNFDLYDSSGNKVGQPSSLPPLARGQQISMFFDENGLFPSLTEFRGMVEFQSQGPVAIVSLLMTQASNDVQFATVVPTDREALRRNSYTAFPMPGSGSGNFIPMDVDKMVVDWSNVSGEEGISWDVKYIADNATTRRIEPVTENGVQIASLGVKTDAEFNAITLADLKKLTYTNNAIDLSDGKPALQFNYAFAVKTDLGNYAIMKIFEIVDSPPDFKDLIFAAIVFK